MTSSARPTGDRRGFYAAVVAVVCVLLGASALGYGFTHRVSPPPQAPLAVSSPSATTGGAPSGGASSGSTASPMAEKGPVAPPSRSAARPTTASAARTVALPGSVPVRLDIPSIGVHSDLLQLGLNGDKTVQVPDKPLQAGWYRGSPTPGETGPSVILGHVDTAETGPAVFYRLGAMHAGDHVSVLRSDGSSARFTVRSVKSYLKAQFPTLEVYGNTTGPELRLITCSVFDKKIRHYVGNTVVFATLDS